MTLIIVVIFVLGCVLIATENLTNINKAAVAMFVGTLGWMLYIAYGTDFVMAQHPDEYLAFLHGAAPSSTAVKEFIAQNIFLKYVGRASEIVLFLIATMTIVEILNNNGCFDFVRQLLKTRSSRRMLWMLSVTTLVISANLDNLTTTTMMLVLTRGIISTRRQRLIYGSAIVLAANCGGALTVIGNPAGLVLWNIGAVTPTNYSMTLLIPCLTAWIIPTWWLGRSLPERVEGEWITMPYRGDDTRLTPWQRLLMLFVGIGGLWFIPSFHSITKLSPFLGALCVLSVLWIVNEIFNRKLMNVDKLIQRPTLRALQYGTIKMILFVMGFMLAVGVLEESGVLGQFADLMEREVHDVWFTGLLTAGVSAFLDNFATAMSMISLHDIVDVETLARGLDGGYLHQFVQNGSYWKIMAYASAIGGNILCTGSLSGLALMKVEHMHVGWYFKTVGIKAALGGLCGFVAMWLIIYFS
ncbi:MAG: sodium:proton antiporter [Prevotella sp.]|nr:sodium:proton antiporter [Prevotella sp.]MDY4039728.1 SLC13 family permease [Prevotella sp.]